MNPRWVVSSRVGIAIVCLAVCWPRLGEWSHWNCTPASPAPAPAAVRPVVSCRQTRCPPGAEELNLPFRLHSRGVSWAGRDRVGSALMMRAAPAFIPLVILLLCLGALAAGCSRHSGLHVMTPNQRPVVEITSTPANSADTAFFAYQVHWSGFDPDGRVDHFTYATDPGDADTTWTETVKGDERFSFRSSPSVLHGAPGHAARGAGGHTIVIKAWDDRGLASEPVARTFYSFTVAPTVAITFPQPSMFYLAQVPPSFVISWTGADPDGKTTKRPIAYKYHLFTESNAEFSYAMALTRPDSLRRYYEAQNYAGWDSVGGRTYSVRLSDLVIGMRYFFVIVAYDEAGATSANFGWNTNMLQFQVGGPQSLGPRISLWNDAFMLQQFTGGWLPSDPTAWFSLEIPAKRPVTLNWSAVSSGVHIAWYRWRVGGDVYDETPRTNEATDWSHWSAKSLSVTSCTIGPFSANTRHLFYLEASDENGMRSLLVAQLRAVGITFDRDLLVIDDTRAEVDQWTAASGTPQRLPYVTYWPSAAELDTFLYARGGVFWRGTLVSPTAVQQPVSPPGLLAGYDFDTLGTRLGYVDPSLGVPLSLLGHYKHVFWLVDHNAALFMGSPSDLLQPQSAWRWMCGLNHLNTLTTYANQGGSVWMAGGAAALASLAGYDNSANNSQYGAGRRVFSSAGGELVPGRPMFDLAHWQSELVCQLAAMGGTEIRRAHGSTPSWSMPGYRFLGTVTSPEYAHLPALLRRKDLALGDTLPPTRSPGQPSSFYGLQYYDAEYLSQANVIVEDIDPDPYAENRVAVLDTLMSISGSGVVNTGQSVYPVMTWYHGVEKPPFVFTGFPIWTWTRSDAMALVDFVLQDLWKMPRQPVARAPGVALTRGMPGPQHAGITRVPVARAPASRIPAGR